jgi:hypothetical protein
LAASYTAYAAPVDKVQGSSDSITQHPSASTGTPLRVLHPAPEIAGTLLTSKMDRIIKESRNLARRSPRNRNPPPQDGRERELAESVEEELSSSSDEGNSQLSVETESPVRAARRRKVGK